MQRTLLEEWLGGMTGFVKIYVLLHNRQKSITKIFTLAVFSIDPFVRTHSKMKSLKKGKEMGDQITVLLD